MATLDKALIKAFGGRIPQVKQTAPLEDRTSALTETRPPAWELASLPIDVIRGDFAAVKNQSISTPLPNANVIQSLASSVSIVMADAAIPALPDSRRPDPGYPPKSAEPPASTVKSTEKAQTKKQSPAMAIAKGIVEGQRRPMPLSLYVHSMTPPAKLRPLLEVDAFRWPEICGRLLAGASVGFAQQCANLLARAGQGTKIVAVTGGREREGRTTLLICMAKRLADNGCHVAIVDADVGHPELAKSLGIGPKFGWEGVVREEMRLEEVLVESVRDGIVLLPLADARPDGESLLRDPRAGLSLATLRARYDLVLVDVGPIVGRGLAGFVSLAEQSAIDGALVLRDSRAPAKEGLADMNRLLAAARVPILGLVDNFTPGVADK
jgi:Mrp family chromosome partitioning ATPase